MSSSSSSQRRPPLKFNRIHGENVRLTNDQRIASRTDSFCKALAFSDRPIDVDEMVCLRFAEVKTSWSGVLRFGVTNTNPATFGDNLPRYACPDMTNKEGTWAKAMSDRYCQQGNIMHFFIRENGEMYYGINGNLKGLFLAGINTRAPLYVVVDIYGNTTSVEFVDESVVQPLRNPREAPRSRPPVPPPPTIPPPAVPTDSWYNVSTPLTDRLLSGSDIPLPASDTPTPTEPTPTPATVGQLVSTTASTSAAAIPAPVTQTITPEPGPSPRQPNQQRLETSASGGVQQLTRELEQRLSFAQIQQRSLSTVAPGAIAASAVPSSSAATPSTSSGTTSRRGTDFAPLSYNKNLPITQLQFHTTRGRNVSLNNDRTIATRDPAEYSCGYVFTARPMRCMEKIIVQILGVQSEYSGGIAFGVTNCDPAELINFDFPDDADELLNRPEFWAVNKDYERNPTISDEMTFFINEKGEVVYQKNRDAARILMHVDPTLSYFMFFDIYARAQIIRCVGTTDARLRPTSPAPPTIPQHRRRQSHQAPNSQGQNRRTVSTPVPPIGFPHQQATFAPPLQPSPARSSGLTVNLPPPPPPDVPRRLDNPRSSQPDCSVQPIGISQLVTPPSSISGRSGPSRHADHNHGRHGYGAPPPRPNRPPPPAPPQRTFSVPTTHTMTNPTSAAASATQATPMPRPSSTSAVEFQDSGPSTSAAAGGGGGSAAAGGRECSVCMDKSVDCAVYPCGHVCMCYECGRTTWQRQGVCPICRREIKDILRLFPQ